MATSAARARAARKSTPSRRPETKENLRKTLLFGSARSPAAQGLPKTCRGPPEGLPRAVSERPKPAQGRPRPAEELRKACPELLRAPESYPEACQKLHRSCTEAAQELPRSCLGALGLDSPTWPQDGCSKSQLNSTTQDIVEKASEHAVESALVRAPCFVPWRLPRSGTRYNASC